MRLKNKKTGEIREWFNNTDGVFPNSLAELNEEWEDYEEPKEYWRITDLGELKSIRLDQHHQNIEKCKQIGNYFETKEEAWGKMQSHDKLDINAEVKSINITLRNYGDEEC